MCIMYDIPTVLPLMSNEVVRQPAREEQARVAISPCIHDSATSLQLDLYPLLGFLWRNMFQWFH